MSAPVDSTPSSEHGGAASRPILRSRQIPASPWSRSPRPTSTKPAACACVSSPIGQRRRVPHEPSVAGHRRRGRSRSPSRRFEVTLGRLDPTGISVTAIDDVCGVCPVGADPRPLAQHVMLRRPVPRILLVRRRPGERRSDESTTYVVPPRTGEPIALEPIASGLPDGFVAYRADYEEIARLPSASSWPRSPIRWREACPYRRRRSPRCSSRVAGGTVFLVEPAPDLASVEVTDIAVLSVPIAGCTSPVARDGGPARLERDDLRARLRR